MSDEQNTGDASGPRATRADALPEPQASRPPVTPAIARCCKYVYGADAGSGFRGSQCSRAGIVERGGKRFCRQHDPEAQKARRDKNYAEHLAKWEEQDRVAKQKVAIAIAERAVIAAARYAVEKSGFGFVPLRHALAELDAAQGIEARRAETGTGSVHESPTSQSEDAPNPTGTE